MSLIAETGLKLDLHIHSCYSSSKDGDKVKNNTLEALPLLVEKLTQNEVNVCSITDHDVFNYEIYHTLKSYETDEGIIKKVLPGVEFSVLFSHAGKERPLHIIAIFSDKDDLKVQNVESVLSSFPPKNKTYTEIEFLEILRKIDIDTILIVHQKQSLYSQGKNDATALGHEKFLEFIHTDYFEALEFRNKRNETFNRTFLEEQNLADKARLVTGTDCHDWNVYPGEDAATDTDFPYTYAKCLPTFRGLVMAITDATRLKRINSFFCADKYTLDSIDLKIDKKDINIPLSKGINVIIGDNSIGKSLLLHAIVGYKKPGTISLDKKVVDGYKAYLKNNNMEIQSKLSKDNIFCFDMQGEVRTKFEHGQLTATNFLSNYFPDPVDSKIYRSHVETVINRMIEYLTQKFQLDAKLSELGKFEIVVNESNAESLTFIKNLRRTKPKTQNHTVLVNSITNAHLSVSEILEKKKILDEEDISFIEQTVSHLLELCKKYKSKIDSMIIESEKIEEVATAIDEISEQHNKGISDSQKRISVFEENTTDIISKIVAIINSKKNLPKFELCMDTVTISPHHNQVHNYEFISKLKLRELSTEYLSSVLSRVLKAHESIDWETITEHELESKLLNRDKSIPVLQFFKESILKIVDEDLVNEHAIIVDGEDRYSQMSAGLNSKIYFDLLSYETRQDGVYIIDQPEDNVSQSSIREYLLDRFKTMGENRQIIMVTHNPQFVVNLDADNLIYITKDSNQFIVQSGALEYSCEEYSILDIVAKNIDGGLESIKKRWKRYEKNSEL